MKNKEIEELLNDMRHSYEIHEEIIKKYNNADKISYPYTINLKQIDLLLSYIEQLEKENEFLKLDNPSANMKHFEMLKENKRKIDNLRYQNKQLKNNRDKAIEYIKNMPYLQETDKEYEDMNGNTYFTYKKWDDSELLNILKGDSDE